jgi:hypothetical protein
MSNNTPADQVLAFCSPDSPARDMTKCIMALPQLKCSDIQTAIDGLQADHAIDDDEKLCADIGAKIDEYKDAASSVATALGAYATWYDDTIAPCIQKRCSKTKTRRPSS